MKHNAHTSQFNTVFIAMLHAEYIICYLFELLHHITTEVKEIRITQHHIMSRITTKKQ